MYEKDGVLLGVWISYPCPSGQRNFRCRNVGESGISQAGYATLIISHLKETCLKAGYTPIAGCAADNIVSRRTLEKCGFMTKHCAIVFEF